MNRIQNEVSRAKYQQHLENELHEAQLRQIRKEHDGLHKWVVLTPTLSLLCRVDEKGTLLPKEKQRIKNIKRTLGIK